jgi:hypothetical protein
VTGHVQHASHDLPGRMTAHHQSASTKVTS